jgi:hypothetical protein
MHYRTWLCFLFFFLDCDESFATVFCTPSACWLDGSAEKEKEQETHNIAILQPHKFGLALVLMNIVIVGEDAFAVYGALDEGISSVPWQCRLVWRYWKMYTPPLNTLQSPQRGSQLGVRGAAL